jgi:3-(3-hydroxy-phenyl)propionate hydroxylase
MTPQADATMYDIAIVGYGPVGATLANLLARYGLKIAVIEQAAGIYDKPRAITLDHEALRVFQACGLAEVMEQDIAPHPGTHYLGVDGQIIKIFDPLPPPFPLGWTPTATFVQPDVEKALRAKLSGYDRADVFLSTKAMSLAQDGACVSLSVNAGGDGERVLRARYLVGCDGANSFVRKQLGIALEDLAFDEWWMVVDAFTADPAKRPAKCFQYCRPSRPGTYLPGPGALRRWEIKLLPGEDPDAAGAPENVRALLQGFTDTSDLTIWRSAVYRFHALLARSWRSGRVFMMGDAVHQTPPFLGQGLCAGIRDAVNLAWKLALVLRGDAGPCLLDSYEIERKPHVRSIVATAKEFGKIIGELDPVAAAARDERLRAELRSGQAQTIRQKFIPDLEGGIIAPGAKAAGSLFVQPSIRLADGNVMRLDDFLAPGFAIVTATRERMNGLSPASLNIWQKLKGERVIVGTSAAGRTQDGVIVLAETERLFADWLDHHEITAVIVRPDRYVFAGAQTAQELNSHISTLAGLLGAARFESDRPQA